MVAWGPCEYMLIRSSHECSFSLSLCCIHQREYGECSIVRHCTQLQLTCDGAVASHGTADDCVVTRSVPTHTISIF